MPDPLLSLVAFGGMVMATFGLGRPLLRLLGARPADRLATAVWSVALGSIAAGWLWLGLALIGGLYVPVIGLTTVAACFWGFLEIFRDLLQTAQRNASPEVVADPNRGDEPDQTPWSPPSRGSSVRWQLPPARSVRHGSARRWRRRRPAMYSTAGSRRPSNSLPSIG